MRNGLGKTSDSRERGANKAVAVVGDENRQGHTGNMQRTRPDLVSL